MTATQAETGGFDLQILAGLSASINGLSDQMRRQQDEREQLTQNIRYISNIPYGQITTTGVAYDQPDRMGPRRGFAWDVRRITTTTFSAGTINWYVDAVADNNIVMVFTTAGVSLLGSGQIVIQDGQRLIAQATGSLTGNVSLSIGVVEVAQQWLGAYLL